MANRRIRCWFDGTNHQIHIARIGTLLVSADGHEIVLTETEADCGDTDVIEAILGPALVLALAIRGCSAST